MAMVDICRLALMRGGQQSIVSIGEKSPEALACALLYEPLRDEVLETFLWPFALHRESLAEIAAPPSGDWKHTYQLPIDCLRAVGIVSGLPSDPPPFAVESGRLLTNETTATLCYVRRIEDTALFSPQFVNALSWRLAADLCLSLTGEDAKARFPMEMYRASLSQAANLQANLGRPPSSPPPAWISARTGGDY